ncbi:MAG: hypothetical protein M4579_007550, partial [Chaenotheca gracillima]
MGEGQDHETRIKAALDTYEKAQKGSKKLSLRKAAQMFDVPASTLHHRAAGRETRQESHVHQQKLSVGEEKIIAERCLQMSSAGFPLSAAMLKQIAGSVLRSHT